jgi:hypothetical protein
MQIVERKALVSLISDKTLFMRMGLVAKCMSRRDCAAGLTCIEGECKEAAIDARTLPDFVEELITHVTCNSGTTFIGTDTQLPMPTLGDMTCAPGGRCEEGTCYKPPPADSDLSSGDMADGGTLVPWTQQTVPTTNTLRAVWSAQNGSDVFAVGDQGTILHATGGSPQNATTWVNESYTSPGVGDLVSVYGFGADDVWAVSTTGRTLHRAGGGWNELPSPGGIDRCTAVWGAQPNEVWVLGTSGPNPIAVSWRGEPSTHSLQGVSQLNALWGTAADDVWAVGNGLALVHWDGNKWDQLGVPSQNPNFRDFFGVWASKTNAYAVGSDPNGKMLLYHWVPGQALPGIGNGPDGSFPLRGVWGRSDTDLYAVGDNGVILHSVGDDKWLLQPTPSSQALISVFGSGSSDTWAVGPGGLVLYSNASSTPGDGGTPADAAVLTDLAVSIDLAPPADMPPDFGMSCTMTIDCPDVPGVQCCQNVCVDTNVEPQHCGGCGLPCFQPNMCQGGFCIPPGSDMFAPTSDLSPQGTDMGGCPLPSCSPTDTDDGGVPTACNCFSNCVSTTYVLDCTGSQCTCFINASPSNMFPNTSVCVSQASAEAAFHTQCGFP